MDDEGNELMVESKIDPLPIRVQRLFPFCELLT